MLSTEFTYRNAETNSGRQSLIHHYVPVSTLEECVVKVVKENREENYSQDNLRLDRTSTGPTVTLRKYLRAQEFPTFQACLGKPRVVCRRGTLTQFHQRVEIGRTRIYKDKQYIQRIQEFSSMMLSRHRRIIPSLKRSTRRFTYMSLLDRFQTKQSPMQCVSKTTRTMLYVVSSSEFMHETTWYSRNNRRLRCSKAEHYLHELRKQIKIQNLYVVMILKKFKWPYFDLAQLEKSIQKHHRKSRD